MTNLTYFLQLLLIFCYRQQVEEELSNISRLMREAKDLYVSFFVQLFYSVGDNYQPTSYIKLQIQLLDRIILMTIM